MFAAVDLGASGGRVMAGSLSGGRVDMRVVRRFANGPVMRDGALRWDVGRLFSEVRAGLAAGPEAESIGIDTWGVDYGLLDESGRLLADPVSHRDDRWRGAVESLGVAEERYSITGIADLPFNTIFQLTVERSGPRWAAASHAVLLPDLLAFWLTGVLATERTNASTTGLLNARTGEWSGVLLDRLGLAAGFLPPVESAGRVRGLTPDGIPVVSVGSHDTASAVVAVPATSPRFAYISCGTWSLVGVEVEAPITTADAREAGFTNEAGVDGRIRFLRNVGGLWLLQECMREWGFDDPVPLLAAAARQGPGGPVIDVEAPGWIPPGRMPERIAAVASPGAPVFDEVQTVRCILDSLAAAYARTVRQAVDMSGRDVDVVHIVGGGARNSLLCQLTADSCELPVVAGPVEATALGNLLVQARTAGALTGSLEDLRAVAARSSQLRRYEPR